MGGGFELMLFLSRVAVVETVRTSSRYGLLSVLAFFRGVVLLMGSVGWGREGYKGSSDADGQRSPSPSVCSGYFGMVRV